MLDITAPQHEVEVQISHDGKTVWLNVDGVCAARVCRIPAGVLTIRDERLPVSFDVPQDF